MYSQADQIFISLIQMATLNIGTQQIFFRCITSLKGHIVN